MLASFCRSMYVLLLLLVCAPPAHGQSRTYAGSILGLDATLHASLLPERLTPAPHQIEPAPLLEFRLAGDAAEARRSRTAYYVAGGAVIGAAVGVAILFAPRDCRTGDSMCGLAIPLYAGAGAAGGGLIGFLVGSSLR